MINSKKGIIDILLYGLIANPYILIGVAVFVCILILMFYFMLGKILGAFMLLFGLFLLLKDWRLAIGVIIIAVIIFFNPFGWSTLSTLDIMW